MLRLREGCPVMPNPREVTVPFGAGNPPYARRLQIPVLAPRSPETPKRPKTWRLDPMKGRRTGSPPSAGSSARCAGYTARDPPAALPVFL